MKFSASLEHLIIYFFSVTLAGDDYQQVKAHNQFIDENLSIQIIEQVDEGDIKTLENQEVYWQNQLRCYIQNGGNAHCRRKEKERKS